MAENEFQVVATCSGHSKGPWWLSPTWTLTALCIILQSLSNLLSAVAELHAAYPTEPRAELLLVCNHTVPLHVTHRTLRLLVPANVCTRSL